MFIWKRILEIFVYNSFHRVIESLLTTGLFQTLTQPCPSSHIGNLNLEKWGKPMYFWVFSYSQLRWPRDQQYSSEVSVTALCRARSWASMILEGLFQLRIFYDSVILSSKTGLPVLLFAGLKLIHLQLTLHIDHCHKGHMLRMLREWGCKGNEDAKRMRMLRDILS